VPGNGRRGVRGWGGQEISMWFKTTEWERIRQKHETRRGGERCEESYKGRKMAYHTVQPSTAVGKSGNRPGTLWRSRICKGGWLRGTMIDKNRTKKKGNRKNWSYPRSQNFQTFVARSAVATPDKGDEVKKKTWSGRRQIRTKGITISAGGSPLAQKDEIMSGARQTP